MRVANIAWEHLNLILDMRRGMVQPSPRVKRIIVNEGTNIIAAPYQLFRQNRLAFYSLSEARRAIVVAALMNFTMFGRKIYAIGGSEEAAMRLGINVRRVKVLIYVIAGAIAGLAGITHMTLARMANPFDLVGMELNVIAAVVLGGARITGGHGTVAGALIGAFVITMINTTLMMIGVPSYWQKVVIGCLIIAGTGLPVAIDRYMRHRERIARPLAA